MKNSKKIKILHITQVQGGVQTYIEQIFTNVDKEKFEMVLACPSEREGIVKMAAKHGLPRVKLEIPIKISPLTDLRCILAAVKLIKELKPDIIHSHSSKAGVIARVAGLLVKPKVIYTPHAYAYLCHTGLTRFFFMAIEKMAIPLTNVLLATSGSEAKRSLIDVRFPAKKVEIYTNSIEILPLPEKQGQKSIKNVTMVGRLVTQKNPMMFVRVCKALTEMREDVFCHIIGAGFDDQWKDLIEKYIEQHGLQKKLTIVQWMDRADLLSALRNTDVFVMTSAFESFGYVAAEAQMLEVPVVATNVDGFNEIIESGVTGYLVEPGDVQGMTEKINDILNDPEGAAQMGRKGRLRVSELFDIRKNIHQLEDFYLKHATAS